MIHGKILFISDLHFKTTNNEYINAFVDETIKYVSENHETLKLCVIGGDLLDTHEKLHQTPYNKVIKFIDELRNFFNDVVILVGNHDYENNQQFLSDKHWMNPLKKWKGVTIVDTVLFSKDYNMCFVPYVPPGRFVEALSTIDKQKWMNSSTIFAHQEFRGCDLGTQNSENGDKWELEYPLVISGHIHKAHSPQPNIIYPGSIIQHNFGEEHNDETGLFVMTYSDNVLSSTERIPIKIPSMETIHCTFENFKEVISNLHMRTLERKRLIVSGTPDEFKAIQKTKEYKNMQIGVKVVFRPSENCYGMNDNKNNSDDSQMECNAKRYIGFEEAFIKILEETDTKELLFEILATKQQ